MPENGVSVRGGKAVFNIIRRILRLAGKRGWKIRLGFFLGFIDGIFEGATFASLIYTFIAIDRGLKSSDIKAVAAILLTGLAGHIVCRYLITRFQVGTGVEVMSEQRLKIGDALKRVSMGFFDRNDLGGIAATATNDTGFIENYSMFILDRVVNGFISTAVVSVFVLIYDWRMGLIVLISIIPLSVIFRLLQKKGRLLGPERQETQAKLVSAALEWIQGIEVIRSFNMEGEKAHNITRAINTCEQSSYNLEKGFVPLLSLNSLLIRLFSAVIIFVISFLALGSRAPVSELFIILISTFVIFKPLEEAFSLTAMMRLMEASMERFGRVTEADFIDADASVTETGGWDIEFRDVRFAYDKEIVVNNLSFRAEPGTVTAIVGESGSGKTTLIKLLARFWDVDSGSILIGGTDIRKMSCDTILKNISMVFQDVYLFNDTVLNNVKFGNPEAGLEEVIAACKKAQAHDFIGALENGYDTVIDEGGSSLSGGEKQRLSIARAILKDAPIILLDEATSSIDPENEKYIQEAINNLIEGKTIIVIAHRLTSIRAVDNILVLDRGRLVQEGTHDMLLNQEGIYKTFWELRQKADSWKITK